MDTQSLRAVDLFAGAGGFSLGAIQAGCELEFAVEYDTHAATSYQQNICEHFSQNATRLYPQSIESLDPSELNDRHFPGDERCDLLLGGPPCQGFSTHRICGAGVDDPRNQLIHRYFDFVKALKPRLFLMENVPGILWKRHQAYLEQFYREGDEAGYSLFPPVVIDARDFGLPQRRKRVFILGLAEGVSATGFTWPPTPTHAEKASRAQGKERLPWASCAKVFKKARRGDLNDQHMNHGPELIAAFKNTPPNGGSRKQSGRVLPCHEAHNGHSDVYGRIDPRQAAPTMTTACINPSKGRFVHPTAHHGITARQAARIQTFPEEFVFHGGLMAAGKQIGNAVPVQLGQHLIEHIARLLQVPPVTAEKAKPMQACA